jgi:hypothetical protein
MSCRQPGGARVDQAKNAAKGQLKKDDAQHEK